MTTESGNKITEGLEEVLSMITNDNEGHIDLHHFTGEYLFSGIHTEQCFTDKDEQYMKVCLVLDDTIYTFEENPQDGQRSCLGDVYIDDWQSIVDNFEPQEVVGVIQDDHYEYSIRFVHPDTDELILRIGTLDKSHDYPFFQFDFNPENMDVVGEFEGEY